MQKIANRIKKLGCLVGLLGVLFGCGIKGKPLPPIEQPAQITQPTTAAPPQPTNNEPTVKKVKK